MKRSRFTEEQIIGVLREQESGMNVAEVCRKHGISQLAAIEVAVCTGGDPDEPQEAATAVCRGTAAGAPSWRSETSPWHASADDAAAGAEPALVAGLCLGHADRPPAVPHPGRS